MTDPLAKLVDLLAPAAARGVEVTILTNHHEVPWLTLKWRFWTTNDSGWGEFKGAGYHISVRDCDGDFTRWCLTRHGVTIAEGDTHEWKPYYHFDACCLAAEAALRADVRRRKAELTGGGQ